MENNTKIGSAETNLQNIDWKYIQSMPVKNIKEFTGDAQKLATIPYSVEHLDHAQREVFEKHLDTEKLNIAQMSALKNSANSI